MKKISSTGNIYDFNISPQISQMKERFSMKSSNIYEKRRSKDPKKLRLLFSQNFEGNKAPSPTPQSTKFASRTLTSKNQSHSKLYDELMILKKKVNDLNEQIAFAKSLKRKKDVQINLRKKELETYNADIQMSKDISPVNIDKLKDSNMISSIKKEYYNVKNLLNEKKTEAKNLELYLKKAKPNNEMQKNEILENQLKGLVAKYKEIQKKNNEDTEKLKNMEFLTKTFNDNHAKIEEMQKNIYEIENNINNLRIEANNMNNKNCKNNEILRKQNINKTNVNKHIEHLMNEKKSKEEIVKMKSIYEKKIQNLQEELIDYKKKCSSNELTIKDLKENIALLEKMKKIDPLKLKIFDYNKLKVIERDPSENVNSKILLLQSLIDESNNKIKFYKEELLSFNEQLKEAGYEPFDYGEIFTDNENIKNINNDGAIIENTNSKNNEDINGDCINSKEKNKDKEIIKNKIEEKIKKIEKSDNKKDLNDTNKLRVESTKTDDAKNDNYNQRSTKTEGLKEQINNNLPITEKSENKENGNNNNKSRKDDLKNDSNPNEDNSLSDESFSEFTFVLIKCLEAKKITSEIAKEKIILIQNKKEEIPLDKFVQQMSNNIAICLNCKNEESLQKLKKWIYFLLNINGNNQNIMNEKFLSLLTNIKIYTPEEEILLGKKVKKYLLPKKDIILNKLEPFKTKYISFLFLKQIIEEQKIEMKDEYSQYLFYALKKFDAPEISLYDLKVQNLFDLMNDEKNDSKMEEESDVEISNEEYTKIITSFGMQLLNYLNSHNITLKYVLGDLIQNISAEDEDDKEENIEIVFIEPFINRMKDIGIKINDDIEIFCLFSRYKVSDEYEVISVNLLEKELENFANYTKNNNKINDENVDKLMEKVQEENENEDNVSNN